MSPNDDLWQRLEAFELDVEGASLPFSVRLARDNAWSPAFAARVALEYKRFLYLACTSGHVVTPSDEVDQAWHQHLTYTRSYWDELCAKVLRQPLHHDPTKGGKSEGQKFENFYERTLQSYRAAFGEEPPADIWPPSHIRFGHGAQFRRINLKRYWVLPRPQLPKASTKVALRLVPATLLLFVLAGCSRSGSLNPFDWYGDEFLALYWSSSLVLLAVSFWLRSQGCEPHDSVFPAAPPDSYALTRLADDGNLPLDTALCSLYWRGLIRVDGVGHISRQENVAPPQHPFERRVWDKLGERTPLYRLRYAMQSSVESLDTELENLGLLLPAEKGRSLNVYPVAVATFLIAVGITKMVVGASRERPIGFLIFTCLVLAALVWFFVTQYSPRRTDRGERYLNHLRATDGRRGRPNPQTDTDVLVMGAALWGYRELENFGFTDLRHQMSRTPQMNMNSVQSNSGGASAGYYGYASGGSSDSSYSGSSHDSGGSSNGGGSSGGSSDSGGGSSGCGGCGGGGGGCGGGGS